MNNKDIINDNIEDNQEIDKETNNNLEILQNILKENEGSEKEEFFDCEEICINENDDCFLEKSIEFDKFIKELKDEDFYITENEEKTDEKKTDEKISKEEEIRMQIRAIEKKMLKKEKERHEARKRRMVSNKNNFEGIDIKLGKVIYVYNNREYYAYHTSDCKIIFNGFVYENIKEWLKGCFMVNIGK